MKSEFPRESALSNDLVVVPPGKESYAEVRHLILQGSDREIGFALAAYAREKLGVEKLTTYADPIYGQA